MMPQKKKQFRFKIPWISSGSRAAPSHKPKSLPPPPSSQAQGTPKDEPKKHPPSRPTHSPASSVAFDESLVHSPSQSPSQPSTPSQDLSSSSSPSHPSSTSLFPLGHSKKVPPQPSAEPSVSEQENEKMKSPLKTTTIPPESGASLFEPLEVTPKELEMEKQSKINHPDEAKEKVMMMEKEPTNKHGESTRRSKTELVHKTAPAPSGVVVKPKDASTREFRADHGKMEPRESIERKMMFATSSSSAAGKDTKVMTSSDPAIRNVSSTSISPVINPLHQSSKENHIPLQKAIKDDISNFVSKLATVTPTQPMDDKNFSVVTLAGENRGATMHVDSNSAKKEGSIHIHRAYKTDPEESTDLTTDSSDENSSRSSDEKDEVGGKAYVNSNIQSVNNSLMLHGSVSERDPGVHLVLQQQQEEPIKKPTLETPRAEVNVNPAEKTSYQPVIRRRCLRGMFLEPSDDEADKPRRHGCKFRCGDKGSEIM